MIYVCHPYRLIEVRAMVNSDLLLRHTCTVSSSGYVSYDTVFILEDYIAKITWDKYNNSMLVYRENPVLIMIPKRGESD